MTARESRSSGASVAAAAGVSTEGSGGGSAGPHEETVTATRKRGLSTEVVKRGLRLDVRQGGEKFRVDGQRHTKTLKKLLQEDGIVPWMRDRVPLVYSGDQLVAVGDLWIADGAAASPGVAVRWSDRPALH